MNTTLCGMIILNDYIRSFKINIYYNKIIVSLVKITVLLVKPFFYPMIDQWNPLTQRDYFWKEDKVRKIKYFHAVRFVIWLAKNNKSVIDDCSFVKICSLFFIVKVF